MNMQNFGVESELTFALNERNFVSLQKTWFHFKAHCISSSGDKKVFLPLFPHRPFVLFRQLLPAPDTAGTCFCFDTHICAYNTFYQVLSRSNWERSGLKNFPIDLTTSDIDCVYQPLNALTLSFDLRPFVLVLYTNETHHIVQRNVLRFESFTWTPYHYSSWHLSFTTASAFFNQFLHNQIRLLQLVLQTILRWSFIATDVHQISICAAETIISLRFCNNDARVHDGVFSEQHVVINFQGSISENR